MMREADIPLLINSDAHAPEEVEADLTRRWQCEGGGVHADGALCRRERRFVPL